MGDEGLELYPDFTGKTELLKAGAAESGAVDAGKAPCDANLREIIEAWPALPESIKAGILAMVQASGDQS